MDIKLLYPWFRKEAEKEERKRERGEERKKGWKERREDMMKERWVYSLTTFIIFATSVSQL